MNINITIRLRSVFAWMLIIALLIGYTELQRWEIKGQRETIARLASMVNDKVTAMIFENGRFVGQITQ